MQHREGSLAEGRVYFQTWQATQPRAEVVIAHGYAENSGRHGHVAAALVAAGFNVWALDHHGHGPLGRRRGGLLGRCHRANVAGGVPRDLHRADQGAGDRGARAPAGGERAVSERSERTDGTVSATSGSHGRTAARR